MTRTILKTRFSSTLYKSTTKKYARALQCTLRESIISSSLALLIPLPPSPLSIPPPPPPFLLLFLISNRYDAQIVQTAHKCYQVIFLYEDFLYFILFFLIFFFLFPFCPKSFLIPPPPPSLPPPLNNYFYILKKGNSFHNQEPPRLDKLRNVLLSYGRSFKWRKYLPYNFILLFLFEFLFNLFYFIFFEYLFNSVFFNFLFLPLKINIIFQKVK